MAVETVDTLVVGGGQAGLAMSKHLGDRGTDHVVLERNRIAERWRSERWDSLVANGPAWHDRFPDMEYAGTDPDAFPTKEAIAEYFDAYARQIAAPIRCGVEVREAVPLVGSAGYRVETSDGVIETRNLVAATGPFQRPVMPSIVPETASIEQLHSSAYRNPEQLRDGGVMVVGAGSSGAQIADELSRAGRDVYLSVGPHDRPPRSYRGRDFVWWLGVLGKWDVPTLDPDTEHVTISVSGARGGHTVDFRRLASQGIALVGRTQSCAGGVLHFASDLGDNIERGDQNYLSVLDEADAYVVANGLDLPAEAEARILEPLPSSATSPTLDLDLGQAGVTSIIWATGYALDYSWLKVDVFDQDGRPNHHRGVSAVSGLYFLGLPWLSRRASSFIFGVWHDAKYLADHVAAQRDYVDYYEIAGQQKGV